MNGKAPLLRGHGNRSEHAECSSFGKRRQALNMLEEVLKFERRLTVLVIYLLKGTLSHLTFESSKKLTGSYQFLLSSASHHNGNNT